MMSRMASVADITLYEREPLVVRERLEVREVARVSQRVESDDRVTRMMLGPEVDEVGADESGGTRHQHSTHRDSLSRSFCLVL
jgi:hypothetical protein